MSNEAKGSILLQEELSGYAEEGIRAEKDKLLRDMCSQFSDPDEWIREYVVNAYDAAAKNCWISGREDGENIAITVRDDGWGMDLEHLKGFFSVFTSIKFIENAIGTHGIGKLSAAAIPGQNHFLLETSTGSEAWRAELGCLLDNDPVVLQAVTPVPKAGSCFTVMFAKREPLKDVLQKLSDVIHKYLRYLPLQVHIQYPHTRRHRQDVFRREEGFVTLTQSAWLDPVSGFSHNYIHKSGGFTYDIVLTMGQGTHEIYQNRVLISNQYNIFSFAEMAGLQIPGLGIRVDSIQFELPFGRHKLRNEKEAMRTLAQHLVFKVIPEYFDRLYQVYMEGSFRSHRLSARMIEDFACALIQHFDNSGQKWSSMPIFATKNMKHLSLDQLRVIVAEKGMLYIEAEEGSGIDYRIFEAPVITLNQPQNGLTIIKDVFAEYFVNLSVADVVLEAPEHESNRLSEREKRFEASLGFNFEHAIQCFEAESERALEARGETPKPISFDQLTRSTGIARESIAANSELNDLTWRLGYLVMRDGKTPCLAHRFLYNSNRESVVLNLYHPEIQQLVVLSERHPELASHWALAYCMTGEGRILKHIPAEMREDILLLDAISKSGPGFSLAREAAELEGSDDADYLRLMRELMESDDIPF
jgi:hypothetical protein